MRPLVVIPTFNEASNIEPLLARMPARLDVLFVDDASPDGTADVIRAQDDPRVGLLERSGKLGLASAYVDGFRLALSQGHERILQMDADLSHAPSDTLRLLDEDADLVLGSRYVERGGTQNWPLSRRLLSRFGSAYARAVLGLEQRDVTGGFKAWRRKTLARVLEQPVSSEGYAFQVEMTWRALQLGASVVEVPILFTERRLGASKMSPQIALEACWRLPLLRLK
ncbi:MAG: polyprenol monophosphomannose synthase [Proteobacteria bacterium]|nr:polyprenol monophosphomannose synthase [Pseudomonadota bacterium]MCP4919408.1 polyprenol monophosphomannose synthase [Pseudomonadota bacterium]